LEEKLSIDEEKKIYTQFIKVVHDMYTDFEILQGIENYKASLNKKNPQALEEVCLDVKCVTSTFYRLLEKYEERIFICNPGFSLKGK
jgi:hypothetical protein